MMSNMTLPRHLRTPRLGPLLPGFVILHISGDGVPFHLWYFCPSRRIPVTRSVDTALYDAVDSLAQTEAEQPTLAIAHFLVVE